MIRHLLISLALVGPTWACAQSLLAPVDGIVAQVEEDVILRSELEDAIANIQRQYAGKPEQLPPADVLMRQVLERLIVNKLQLARAEGTGVEVTDTEIDNAIARLAQQNNVSVMQMRDMLARDGLNFADFRQQMHDELMVQKLRQRVVDSRSNVSESEVDIAMASDSLKLGEVRLAHILVAVPQDADADAIERGRSKIEGVKKLIDEGKMDFQAAAIRYSDSPNALEGGDLGWRRFDQIPEAFAQTIEGMAQGVVSNPIRALSGFHLIKVLETRDEGQVMVTEFNARHIVVDINELVSEREAQESIEAIRSRILAGGDFAKEAREHSDETTTANLGGDMGWFQIEAFGSTYAELISQLKDGDLSEPFRTERGWHLLKRESERTQDRTQEFVRNQAREGLRRRKGEEAYEQFLRQLRSESFVEIKGEKTEAPSEG
jgi:peptidyl-prolyl cis-trans isomerase SurA